MEVINTFLLLYYLSNIKSFHREDVNTARLKVVPQVVGRDHQRHLTGVPFFSIEFDVHVGVWAASRDVSCLHSDVIRDVWHTDTKISVRLSFKFKC